MTKLEKGIYYNMINEIYNYIENNYIITDTYKLQYVDIIQHFTTILII